MTDDLVQFLRDRLDEDQADADKHQPEGNEPTWYLVATFEQNYPCSPYLQISKARALAEVDSKRRVLDLYNKLHDDPKRDSYDETTNGQISGLWFAIRSLASPYGTHPEYRPEWAPDA